MPQIEIMKFRQNHWSLLGNKGADLKLYEEGAGSPHNVVLGAQPGEDSVHGRQLHCRRRYHAPNLHISRICGFT
jgi:hypothetical protein